LTTTALRLRAGVEPTAARTTATRVPVAVLVAWAALFVNVLAFNATTTVFPIPGTVAKLVTQGALVVGAMAALLANPKGVLRLNAALVLMALLVVQALMVSIHSEFLLGSTFRATRFLGFVATLWLLSPWFGRRDMTLLRCHLWCLVPVLASVVLGVLVAPGVAFSFDGRLSGVIWPVPPTQVAHYAAVLLGTTALLWMCQVISGRVALICIVGCGLILVGTHTRTALVALLAGVVVGAASLFLGNSRVRRTSAWGLVLAFGVAALFANEIKAWALRGQSGQDVGKLTGRTDVWNAVIHTPRTHLADLFGSGMSNLSFNGLPIDSNWVGTYLDLGLAGALIDALLLVTLLVVALTSERSPQRALALFLVVYCLFASITETGMSNPSPYLLDMVVAASLILPRRVVTT